MRIVQPRRGQCIMSFMSHKSTDETGRVVEGVFRLPDPVLFESNHLGVFHTTIGGLAVTLLLPSFVENKSDPNWHSVTEPPRRYPDPEPGGEVDRAHWGFAGGRSTNTDGTTTSNWTVMVARFRFTTPVANSDEASTNAAQTIYDALKPWWVIVSSWIELFTHQNLNPPVRERPQLLGQTVPFWSSRDGETPYTVSVASKGTLKWPRSVNLVDGEVFQKCLDLAAEGLEPPFEWMLIRDARSLLLSNEYRRAVLDAGTAAELAIMRKLDDILSETSIDVQDALLAKYRMLGASSDLLTKLGGELPDNFRKNLIEARNRAAHTGISPKIEQASAAVEAAAEMVEIAIPLASLTVSALTAGS